MKHLFRRPGNGRGHVAPAPADPGIIDRFCGLLAALHNPQPWAADHGHDIAVWVGPHIERAHPRPGDDHGTDMIAVTLVHPDTPHAAAYLHGHKLGYASRGWLRCETAAIIGTWQPAYTMLTHAAAGRPLPDDVGMEPAHYGVHIEARRPDGTGYVVLRLGPYTQTWVASRDADHLNAELAARHVASTPRLALKATAVPFDVSDHESYTDPHGADLAALLANAITIAAA